MDESVKELLASLFHFPAGITVNSIHPSANDLVIQVACSNPSMPCPDCQQPSCRIHSHYQRTVADVPCAGRNVILALTVRKFVCGTPGCPHRIFTERLPDLILSYARMTRRLTWLLQITGLATGGELGTRLAERHGIATTPSTLLRHLMKYPTGVASPVRVLGVDDWNWKKGRRYGTLLVDLERHEIIDVLEDRESATFAAWLLEHPEVEIVSRDRATQYAAAARKAAPRARQVADRFHLVHNLVEILERLLARCRPEICRADQEPLPEDRPPPEEPSVSPPPPQVWQQHPTQRAERAYEAHRIEREDRYRQMAALHARGMKQAEIAKHVGVSTYQVRTWLKRGSAPIHRRPAGHWSIFDPTAETAYGLAQDFLTMVRKREGKRLDAWIKAVLKSEIPELNSFVCGILKDKDAVVAGLTLAYSNGPVEAQVDKLKLVKRSMFGRAKLPLLRQRLRNKV